MSGLLKRHIYNQLYMARIHLEKQLRVSHRTFREGNFSSQKVIRYLFCLRTIRLGTARVAQ
jgi:hypothetical protein